MLKTPSAGEVMEQAEILHSLMVECKMVELLMEESLAVTSNTKYTLAI